jgi:hypothetical protein
MKHRPFFNQKQEGGINMKHRPFFNQKGEVHIPAIVYIFLAIVLTAVFIPIINSTNTTSASQYLQDRGYTVFPPGIALPSGALVGTTDVQTLTNKTLTSPTISNPTISNLTNGRVPIAGAGGLLGDDADLTFSGDTLTVTGLDAPTGRSATIVVASSDATATEIAQADYPLTGVADNVILTTALNAANATDGTVVVLGQTITLAAGVTVPDGVSLICNQLTNFDASAIAINTEAITLVGNNVTRNIKITGGTDMGYGGGININNAAHIRMYNTYVTDCKDASDGWAHAIHIVNASYDVIAYDTRIYDCDRDIEIEDSNGGAAPHDITFIGGYIDTVLCNGSSPLSTLNAHADFGLYPYNVTFRDFTVINSAGIGTTLAHNIVYDGIRVVAPTKSGSTVGAWDVKITNSYFESADGATQASMQVGSDTGLTYISDTTFANCHGYWAIDQQEGFLSLSNVTVKAPTAGNGLNYALSAVAGRTTQITNSHFLGAFAAYAMSIRGTLLMSQSVVTGATVWLRSTATGSRLIANTLLGGVLNDGGTSNIIERSTESITQGEHRVYSGSLTSGVANAIAFAWHNPNAQDVLVTKVAVEITTGSVTANSVVDVGIADDATGTNRGVEFFDDLDANDVDINDSWLAGDGGTQTKWVLLQDSASATDGWIVGQILVADAAALVGKYYIEIVGR